MSDNEEKKQRTFYINPILLSTVFIITFMLCVCYFIEGNKCGVILIFGSVIIFIILVVGGTARDIIKSKEEKMYQEQSQTEIIQPEKRFENE